MLALMAAGRPNLNRESKGVPMSDLAKKYAEFSHSFVDPWTDDGEETSFTFHFARPNKAQIKRMQDTAGKSAAQASRNLLVEIVHPDEKDTLLEAFDNYPGLVTAFASAIIKGVGVADLGK